MMAKVETTDGKVVKMEIPQESSTENNYHQLQTAHHQQYPTINSRVIMVHSSASPSASYNDSSNDSSTGTFDDIRSPLAMKKHRSNKAMSREMYLEKRRRNNESVKKCRELRKKREQETTSRLKWFEQENMRLATQVEILKRELDTLRQLFANCHHSDREHK